MKKIIFSSLAVMLILFTACNNSGSKNTAAGHDMNNMSNDTTRQAVAADDVEMKTVAVAFTDVDSRAAVSMKEITGHYLHIKNALANDNGAEAAKGAQAMEDAISKLDKSLLTVSQKKVYDEMEGSLKEHADHIANNGGKIAQQRLKFSMLSEVVYDLVKSFGAGQPVYYDHCPMYNENKGANWLSEMKEVKNPYYGSAMLSCGSVKEVIGNQ